MESIQTTYVPTRIRTKFEETIQAAPCIPIRMRQRLESVHTTSCVSIRTRTKLGEIIQTTSCVPIRMRKSLKSIQTTHAPMRMETKVGEITQTTPNETTQSRSIGNGNFETTFRDEANNKPRSRIYRVSGS